MSSKFWLQHRRQQRALDAFWDAVVERSPAEPIGPEAIDPQSAAAVRRLHSLAPKPAPAQDFAERLFAELVQAIPEPGQTSTASAHSTSKGETDVTTSTIAVPAPGARQWRDGKTGRRNDGRRLRWPVVDRRWAIAQLAAAALFIAAIIGGGYYLFEQRNDQHAVVPLATPEATPTAGWTHQRGDAARSGLADSGPTGRPIELWRVQTESFCVLTPIVIDQVVFERCDDGILRALSVVDGSEVWQLAAGEPRAGGISAAGGLLYIGNEDGAVIAVDMVTGSERWRANVPDPGEAAVEIGLLAVPSGDGQVYGIDGATGEELWRYQVTTTGRANTPAIANGLVYAGSSTGEFAVIDGASGELRWGADTGDGGTGTAVVAGGVAYIGASPDLQNTAPALLAYDADTGEELWRLEQAIFTPAVSDGVGYSGSIDGFVTAFNTANGTVIWQIQVGGTARPGAVAGDVLYVASDGDQTVYALDTASGAELWRFKVDGPLVGSIAVNDGNLYVATETGSIYGIGGTQEDVLQAPAGEAAAESTPASPETAAIEPPVFLWSTSIPDGGGPLDIAFQPDGNLLVGGLLSSQLWVLSPDGEILDSWGTAGTGPGQFGTPVALAFDAAGNLYVADMDRDDIQMFGPDRQLLRGWGSNGTGDGQFGEVSGIAIAPNGNLYVSDATRDDIQVFTPDGTFLFAFGGRGKEPGQMDNPSYPAFDAEGNLWVSEYGNHRLSKYSQDGEFLFMFGELGSKEGQLNGQNSVSIDAAGNLYVADLDNRRIQVFDANGNFLMTWGHRSRAEGQFGQMASAELDGLGNIYVADTEWGRVQKFQLLPPLGPEASPTA